MIQRERGRGSFHLTTFPRYSAAVQATIGSSTDVRHLPSLETRRETSFANERILLEKLSKRTSNSFQSFTRQRAEEIEASWTEIRDPLSGSPREIADEFREEQLTK